MTNSVNWRELDHSSFLSWFFIEVFARQTEENKNAINEATDKFRNIKLTMQFGGVEVDNPIEFMSRIEAHMKSAIKSAARELVVESVDRDFDELRDVLDNARRIILNKFPINDAGDWLD